MSVSLRWAAAAALLCTVTAVASGGPQPMVLFKQSVRIGSGGGRLSAACGNLHAAVPQRIDTYRHFSGNSKVTPYTGPGFNTPGKTVSLDDAINKYGWLKVTGDGTTEALRVVPTGKLPKAEFQFDIPGPDLGTTTREDLTEQLKREEKYGTASLNQRIGALRESLRESFGDNYPFYELRIQEVMWDARDEEGFVRQTAKKALERLEGKVKEAKEDAQFKPFVERLRASQRLAHELAGGQSSVGRAFDQSLRDLASAFVLGDKRGREETVRRLTDVAAALAQFKEAGPAKEFLDRLKAAGAAAGDLPLPELTRDAEFRLQAVLGQYLDGTPADREPAEKRLADLSADLARWKAPEQVAFFGRVAAARDRVGGLPPSLLREHINRRVTGVLYDVVPGGEPGLRAGREQLAGVERALGWLDGDAGRQVLARFEQAERRVKDLTPPDLAGDASLRLSRVIDQLARGDDAGAVERQLVKFSAVLDRLGQPSTGTFLDELDQAGRRVNAPSVPLSLRESARQRLRDIRDEYVWGEEADRAAAPDRLGRLKDGLEQLGGENGKAFFERVAETRGKLVRVSAFAATVPVYEQLRRLELTFAWGSEREARLARDELSRLAGTAERLTTPEARAVLDQIAARQRGLRELPPRAQRLAVEWLGELARDYVWGTPGQQRQVAKELADEGLAKRLDQLKTAEIGNFIRQLDAASALLSRARSDRVARGQWDKYLVRILRDRAWGTEAERTAADGRLNSFKADLERSGDRVAEARRPELARPVFKNNTVFLAVGGMERAPTDAAFRGKTVLVDARELPPEHFRLLALQLREAGGETNFCLQLSEEGAIRMRRLPDADSVQFLGDSQRLDALPPALRPTLTGWLTRLATEYRGQPGPAGRGVELIVDHFDGENGRAFERLQGRIERGEFRDKHLVLLICNPDLPAFRALAKLALTRGGVQSVTIPRDPLQAAPSPLVVEVLRDRFRRSPVRNPAEAVAEATRDVRERLERCAEDPNPQQALRAEFGGTADDPVKLFQRNGAFDKDMLREMIKSLKLQEKSFIPLVKNDRTRGDESSG